MLSSREQGRAASPKTPLAAAHGEDTQPGSGLGGPIHRVQAAPHSRTPPWAPHALQALGVWIALAWQGSFCLFWAWLSLLSLSFQGYQLIHQVLCFHGLLITVCEKQTNKQTLTLLGSIGPKKGPRANNKLLSIWSATSHSTGRL